MVVDLSHKSGHHRGMATTKATKAAAYLRVSGLGQVEGDGFKRQRDRIDAWAKANGHEVVAEFRDEGVSGTNELADREGLVALFDRIDSNGVRVVVVENATRLARDLMVGEVILSQFRERGVRVVSAEGGIDLTDNDDPTAELMRHLLGAISHFDRRVTVAKLRAARDRRSREAGRRVEGARPFGMTESERATLGRMRQLHAKPRGLPRRSFATIASILNAEGHATRRGGPWKPESVRKILKRPTTIRVIEGDEGQPRRVVVVNP